MERKIDEMSISKEDDSPQQQINEQSLAEDLEKNRECKCETPRRRGKPFID